MLLGLSSLSLLFCLMALAYYRQRQEKLRLQQEWQAWQVLLHKHSFLCTQMIPSLPPSCWKTLQHRKNRLKSPELNLEQSLKRHLALWEEEERVASSFMEGGADDEQQKDLKRSWQQWQQLWREQHPAWESFLKRVRKNREGLLGRLL